MQISVNDFLKNGVSRPGRVIMVLLLIMITLLPFFIKLKPFVLNMFIMIFLYAIVAQAWNLLAGYCGQVALGIGVFFGIGAYATALPKVFWGLNPWLGLITGVFISVIIALVIGNFCFQLHGIYFTISTLAILEIIRNLVMSSPYFGKAAGFILPLEEEGFLNFQFHSNRIPYYYIILFLMLICTFTVYYINNTKIGYYLKAIRDDEDAAMSVGINITRTKLIAFMVASAYISMAGSFYSQYIMVIDPEYLFSLTLSIMFCLTAMVGGIGSIVGPVIGAFVLIPLEEYSRVLFGGSLGAVDIIIYSSLIVLIAIIEPRGAVAVLHKIERFFQGYIKKSKISHKKELV